MSDNLPVRFVAVEHSMTHGQVTVSLEQVRAAEDKLERHERVQTALVEDLEVALNLIRGYQRDMSMAHMPDKQIVAARNLLHKYKMSTGAVKSQDFRIYADGVDITEHPDSMQGSAIETVELVQLESGEMKFLPVETNDESDN